jgi:predicted AlkP superfamily phosphohydrolase/phosphomutase
MNDGSRGHTCHVDRRLSPDVLAIGLDTAEVSLLERWMDAGHLPVLAGLRAAGGWWRLANRRLEVSETPWTNFLTGRSPEATGYWGPLRLVPGSYDLVDIGAYAFDGSAPFYALDDSARVAVFDVPHARVTASVSGVQVTAWGAHSAQAPGESRPEGLFDELVARYGRHPAFKDDHASVFDTEAQGVLLDRLLAGIERRTDIALDLLSRERWNLFLTAYSEPHASGHAFWHLGRTDHPLGRPAGRPDDDWMLRVQRAIDTALGRLLSAAGDETTVVVFATHGMGVNHLDLPSMVFLPELLYRWSFPGKRAMRGDERRPVPPPVDRVRKNSWVYGMWDGHVDPDPVRQWLRLHLPARVYERLEPLRRSVPSPLESPWRQKARGEQGFFQPVSWYRPSWPRMPAFALPSFSDGFVRLNVAGREPSGVVPTDRYGDVCTEVTNALHGLRDARTGRPLVEAVHRTRREATDPDPRLPDADLVVEWAEAVTDTADHPEFGRIGPLPYVRTGAHRNSGFCVVAGPAVAAGTRGQADAADLTPTLLALMGQPVPGHVEGTPLARRSADHPPIVSR